jgi:hypothetical protein
MFRTSSTSWARLILAAAFLPVCASLALAQGGAPQKPQAQTQKQAQTPVFGAGIRERMNNWIVGLAAGLPEGAPLRFAAEIARVVDDGDEMRVIPMVTRGVGDNLKDLLYLRGVDAAIVHGDALGELKGQQDVQRKVNYIANLFPAELHILARPEIKTLEDLNGKTVNFNTKGTPAAYTGPIIFDKLQIKVTKAFLPHPVAVKQMTAGSEIAAVVLLSSKPLDSLTGKKWPEGFHFLPVPWSIKLGQYYLPSTLMDTDYPGLIATGQKVPTIAVPVVLAVFDWQKGSDRFRRMERFVQYLFTKLTVLQTQPGYHPKWKDVNLGGKVPGWNRFPPAQAELDKLTSSESLERFRAVAAKEYPNDPAGQERLFQEFVRWSRDQAVRGQAAGSPQ